MIKQMILLDKTYNWERAFVSYYITTKNVTMSSHYQNKEGIKRYQRSNEGKITRKRYVQSEKGKAMRLISDKKYNQSGKGKATMKKYIQSEKGKVATKKHHQSKNYKVARIKGQTKRQRNLQWFLMFPNPFDDSIEVDYHHINDAYVVAVPRELHRMYLGKFHREKTMEIVKQIYLRGD